MIWYDGMIRPKTRTWSPPGSYAGSSFRQFALSSCQLLLKTPFNPASLGSDLERVACEMAGQSYTSCSTCTKKTTARRQAQVR
jgi:hypothetical protein